MRFRTRIPALLIAALVVACGQDDGSEKGSPEDASHEDALRVDDSPDGDTCDDPRHFNDYKVMDDFCWAPPEHYCAQGGGAAITTACDPESGVCCRYASTCIPCGFIDCTLCTNGNHRPDCPAVCDGAHSSDPVACRQPDPKLTICYDDVR